jgi:hypothetical protein
MFKQIELHQFDLTELGFGADATRQVLVIESQWKNLLAFQAVACLWSCTAHAHGGRTATIVK